MNEHPFIEKFNPLAILPAAARAVPGVGRYPPDEVLRSANAFSCPKDMGIVRTYREGEDGYDLVVLVAKQVLWDADQLRRMDAVTTRIDVSVADIVAAVQVTAKDGTTLPIGTTLTLHVQGHVDVPLERSVDNPTVWHPTATWALQYEVPNVDRLREFAGPLLDVIHTVDAMCSTRAYMDITWPNHAAQSDNICVRLYQLTTATIRERASVVFLRVADMR